MWEALSAGTGGRTTETSWGTRRGQECLLGKHEKGAQRGEGDETLTEAEKEAGRGEERELWPVGKPGE